MSNYTHKPGTGVLFKNDKKTSANQPDMTGAGADESGNQIIMNLSAGMICRSND